MLAGGVEADGLRIVGELDGAEGEPVGLIFLLDFLTQGRCEFRVIERQCSRALHSIDQDELLRSALEVVAIPELGVLGEPVGLDPIAVNAAGRPRYCRLEGLARLVGSQRTHREQEESRRESERPRTNPAVGIDMERLRSRYGGRGC